MKESVVLTGAGPVGGSSVFGVIRIEGKVGIGVGGVGGVGVKIEGKVGIGVGGGVGVGGGGNPISYPIYNMRIGINIIKYACICLCSCDKYPKNNINGIASKLIIKALSFCPSYKLITIAAKNIAEAIIDG